MIELKEMIKNAIIIDGYEFDEAIIGVVEDNSGIKVLYSKEKVLSVLCNNGMTYDDALDFYEFNILGAYMGESTPVFLVTSLTATKNENGDINFDGELLF